MKNIIAVTFLMFALNLSYSQWIPTYGPATGSVKCLTVSGVNIFAGTAENGIYRTTNNGANWNAVNNGITNQNILSIVTSGSNILLVHLEAEFSGQLIMATPGFLSAPFISFSQSIVFLFPATIYLRALTLTGCI